MFNLRLLAGVRWPHVLAACIVLMVLPIAAALIFSLGGN